MATDNAVLEIFPEVNTLFGVFPMKYGSCLIALYGLASGLVGLFGVILYGIGAFNLLFYVLGRPSEEAKKVVLMTVGVISLTLTVKNALLLCGVMCNSHGMVFAFVWLALFMLVFVMLGVMGLPLQCFFTSGGCALNAFTWTASLTSIVFFFLFLCFWTYFMLVVNSYRTSMIS